MVLASLLISSDSPGFTSRRAKAVKILEEKGRRHLTPAPPHKLTRSLGVQPSNFIIGTLGCVWKPQSCRSWTSKTQQKTQFMVKRPRVKSGRKPPETLGNPPETPSETPLATHRKPFENKNSSDTVPMLRLFPNPIPSNVA